MEPLIHPHRARYRWWARAWGAVFELEAHAQKRDPTIERLPLSLVHSNPVLRRHFAAHVPVPAWDVWGYIAAAEGPWPTRRLVALFPQAPWEQDPTVLCLDGPTDSLHRNTEHELCLYYVRDPDERRWKVSDGLVRLFDLGRRHLMCEHLWRQAGRRDTDWPVVDAQHGYGPAAAHDPTLRLPAELSFDAHGRPEGALAA